MVGLGARAGVWWADVGMRLGWGQGLRRKEN